MGVANSAAARYGRRHACPLGSGGFVDEGRGVVKRAVAELGSLEVALAIWLLAGGPCATLAAQACVGTVDAPTGRICGLSIAAPVNTSRALYGYRGIPYAQPPVGDLRWAPPQPYPRWSDLRA